MALDTTICGLHTDSYVTLAEADTYFENHFSAAKTAAWSALSDPQKESALRAAIPIIETLPFLDSLVRPAGLYQVRIFPRTCDWLDNGYYYPQQTKDGQCEQAVYLLSIDESILAAQMQGLREEIVTAGNVSVDNIYSSQGSHGGGRLLAPMALELLRGITRRSTRIRRA